MGGEAIVQTAASQGSWFLRNRNIVLPEDGTRVLKHVAETYLMYVLIRNCAFGS